MKRYSGSLVSPGHQQQCYLLFTIISRTWTIRGDHVKLLWWLHILVWMDYIQRWTDQPVYLIEAETNGRHFADDIFKCICLNENVWNPIKISLKFVPMGPINNIPAMVQIMAWRRPGDKPLSEPMVVSLSTHIYVARPQWVMLDRVPS